MAAYIDPPGRPTWCPSIRPPIKRCEFNKYSIPAYCGLAYGIDDLCLVIYLSIFVRFAVWCSEHEYRLTKYLMANYEKSVRPIANSSLPVIVHYDVSIHQIIDVDEKNQILTTNCWITANWNDTHFMWNASDFGNVSTIRLPFDKVWLPDIILYNK